MAIVPCIVLASAVSAAAALAASPPTTTGHAQLPISQAPDPPAPSIWSLTEHLTPEQRKNNAQVYAALPVDPQDADNAHDARARELALDGSPVAVQALYELSRRDGRPAQAAAGRALVFLAQQASANGDHPFAGRHALNVYLSGTPHRVRMEALRVLCRSGDVAQSARQIQLIEDGKQDAPLRPLLAELRAAREARIQELSSERGSSTGPAPGP